MIPALHDEIGSLIQRPAVMVHLDDSLRQAAEMLSGEAIGAAVVKGTHPPALISERDVVNALAEGLSPEGTRVRDVMTEDLAVAAPSDGILAVVHRMLDNEIRHMPVVEDDVVIGVVSARDALRALAERIETGS